MWVKVLLVFYLFCEGLGESSMNLDLHHIADIDGDDL